ncbi:MAG: hypothetical protein U9R32_04290 [Bacteroidota bacterium]|nr:hypothetical protein [Bacteroidota bacterium]
MSSKVINLNELKPILIDKTKTDEGILHFLSTFKIHHLLKPFNTAKTKGISVSTLLYSLIIFRLRGHSIHNVQNHHMNFLPKIDDNSFYRLMNNSFMNWRKLLMAFSKQFNVKTKEKGVSTKSTTCFVLDDTDIEKTGKTIEFIGRIFNHVTKLHPLGFKMLLLAYWDGKSLIPVDFSKHREKGKKGNFGMKKKGTKIQI